MSQTINWLGKMPGDGIIFLKAFTLVVSLQVRLPYTANKTSLEGGKGHLYGTGMRLVAKPQLKNFAHNSSHVNKKKHS